MNKNAILSIIMITMLMLTTACATSEPTIVTPKVDLSSGQATNQSNSIESTQSDEDTIAEELQTTTPTESSKTYRTTEYLNLREGPSTENSIITTIPKGEFVTHLSESDMWVEVSYQSVNGYVSSAYLLEYEMTDTTPIEASSATQSVDPEEGYDVPILMYHAIDEYKGHGIQELYVTPANFESQMQYLKEAGFTPITFDDFKKIKDIPKPILITFDDGYQNNINAYHILKKLNSPSFQAKATIFMIGKKIDTKNGLSTAQLKEMSDSGIISIQSHTETHPSLPTLTDFEEELGGIKNRLEGITGKKVTAIAYPSGQYDQKVISETEKYYEYAVTTNPGIAYINSSPYEMKRVRINYSTTLSTFESLVNQ
jgi:peptidoglycan/xylan/chitin deacetylase (PgdA/CDA1 family)